MSRRSANLKTKSIDRPITNDEYHRGNQIIQDIMRKDVGVDGDAQRISQLVWMVFLKILDDREAELELIEDDSFLRFRRILRCAVGLLTRKASRVKLCLISLMAFSSPS